MESHGKVLINTVDESVFFLFLLVYFIMSDKPPVNFFDKATRMFPDPLGMFMHPLFIPMILSTVILLYLSGKGSLLLNNVPILCGALGFIFLMFIIVILYKKPSWQRLERESEFN